MTIHSLQPLDWFTFKALCDARVEFPDTISMRRRPNCTKCIEILDELSKKKVKIVSENNYKKVESIKGQMV